MITVVGAGLAGSLLSLELAARGIGVRLLDGGSASDATGLSYGLLPRGAAEPWRRLQRRHGDLGLRMRWLRWGEERLPVPAWQVEPGRLHAALGKRLERLAVERSPERLQQLPAEGTVVLACGAGCRALAPGLAERLGVSWAGILELDTRGDCSWLGWPRGLARMPERFTRLELERRAPELRQEAWVVDPALVPCGDRLLAGQISLIRPGMKAGEAPEPTAMEQRLRQALAPRWPALAHAPGRYRQAPVSFCSDGVPLAGQVAPGLWALAGFSAAFSQLPAAAASLAGELAADSRP